jgi:hypothetical protein
MTLNIQQQVQNNAGTAPSQAKKHVVVLTGSERVDTELISLLYTNIDGTCVLNNEIACLAHDGDRRPPSEPQTSVSRFLVWKHLGEKPHEEIRKYVKKNGS